MKLSKEEEQKLRSIPVEGLEKAYWDVFAECQSQSDTIGRMITYDDMYDAFDNSDFADARKYEDYLEMKVDFLEHLCRENGIDPWAKYQTENKEENNE